MKSNGLNISSARYEEFFNGTADRFWITIKNPDPVNSYAIDLFAQGNFGNVTTSTGFNIAIGTFGPGHFLVSLVINGTNYPAGPVAVSSPAALLTALNNLYGVGGSLFNGGTWYMIIGATNVFYYNQYPALYGDLIYNFQNHFPVTTTNFAGTPLVVGGSIPYNELAIMGLGAAYKINRIYSQGGSQDQVTQPLQIQYKQIDGNIVQRTAIPLIDPYQWQVTATRPIPFKDFILNGDTLISQYNVVPSGSITLFFDYTKASPYDMNTTESASNMSSDNYPSKKVQIKAIASKLKPRSKMWLEVFEHNTF